MSRDKRVPWWLHPRFPRGVLAVPRSLPRTAVSFQQKHTVQLRSQKDIMAFGGAIKYKQTRHYLRLRLPLEGVSDGVERGLGLLLSIPWEHRAVWQPRVVVGDAPYSLE